MMKTTARKASDAMLIGNPSFPRLNFEGNMAWPERRLQTKQPMQTVYETMRTPFVKDTRLLKATTGKSISEALVSVSDVLPVDTTLMSESRHEMTVDAITAFRGTSRVGLTYCACQVASRSEPQRQHTRASQSAYGVPLSRLKANICRLAEAMIV